MKPSSFFSKAWNSTTIMTWMSYLTKSANLLLVLPLILKNFQAPEIAVWTLFTAILSLCGIADFGFSATFIRLFSFAFGGAKELGIIKDSITEKGLGPNWKLIEEMHSSMKMIYRYLSVAVFIILISLGSLALLKPISATANQTQTWIAWIIMAVAIVYDFYGKIYSNYLEGLFQIALVRRIETFTKLASICTSFIVLIFAPTLLNLVIANSIWMILNTLRDRYICRYIFEGRYKFFRKHPFNKELFLKIWRPAWRGGISGLMSLGLTNLSGILYAQIGSSEITASYMIALRFITEIRNISNAPFYSKIPLMARLRAEGNIKKLTAVAQRGMFIAHIVFSASVIIVGLYCDDLIKLIGSNIHFVNPVLWALIGLAFYAHRYGAMHMQLYLTTNHVIAYIADGISGIIFIIFSILLIKPFGIYALPAGMLAGYLGFYVWFAAYHSLKSINSGFLSFEKKSFLVPGMIFIFYCLSIFIFV